MEIRRLGPGDAGVFDGIVEDVFDGPLIAQEAAAFLTDAAHPMVVAIDRGRVVGMISSVVLRHPDKRPQLWINEVGVSAGRSREGIGRLLPGESLQAARERGCVEAWVASDLTDEALSFHRALSGMEEDGQTHFTWGLGAH